MGMGPQQNTSPTAGGKGGVNPNASAYENSAGLMGQASNAYANMANQSGNNVPQITAPTVDGQINVANSADPATINPATSQGQTAAMSMNQYISPYQQQVIDATTGQMLEQRKNQLNSIGDQASAGGAFGGARHGLLEAQTISDSEQNIGNMTSSMLDQGFNTAAQLGANDASLLQNNNQFNSQLGYNAQAQNAANSMANNQFNTQLGFNQQASNIGYDQFNAGNNMAAQQGNQSAWLNNQNMNNSMNQAGAAGLANMGNNYFNVGNQMTNAQANMGSQQQQLLQSILSGGAGQFGQMMQNPQQALSLISALTGSDPRNGAGMTSGTSSYNPGFFDYLSLGTQLGGQAMNAGMFGNTPVTGAQ